MQFGSGQFITNKMSFASAMVAFACVASMTPKAFGYQLDFESVCYVSGQRQEDLTSGINTNRIRDDRLRTRLIGRLRAKIVNGNFTETSVSDFVDEQDDLKRVWSTPTTYPASNANKSHFFSMLLPNDPRPIGVTYDFGVAPSSNANCPSKDYTPFDVGLSTPFVVPAFVDAPTFSRTVGSFVNLALVLGGELDDLQEVLDLKHNPYRSHLNGSLLQEPTRFQDRTACLSTGPSDPTVSVVNKSYFYATRAILPGSTPDATTTPQTMDTIRYTISVGCQTFFTRIEQ